jgi:AcrR family transcriptional regulator
MHLAKIACMARTYSSRLRAEQAEATRLRVLEAAARVLARPLPDFSIPDVAAEAGVAVATVYRHFKTKSELIDGLAGHYMEQLVAAAGLALGETPARAATADELYPTLRAVFEQQTSLDPSLQAAFATQMADEARRAHREERVHRVENWLAAIAAGMDPDDRRRLIELYVVLGSSATRRSFDVLLGASPAHAAEVIAWAIRRLAASSAGS